jgi:outer membrane protein insertion porin family
LEKGTYFLYDTLFVKSSSLQNHIFIKQGDRYSKEKFDLTLNNLTQLGPYKFVNAKLNPVGDSIFDAAFFLYPDKRYEIGYNVGLYTEESNVGTEPSITFSDKNLSKSANQLQLSLSAGIAVPVYNIDSIFYQLDAQISLLIPKIEGLPVSLQRLFSKNSLPHTRFTLSADYQNQVNLYSLTSFNASYGFEWRENAAIQHVINPINISVIIPHLSSKFQAYVDSNEILEQSFRHEFITGFQYSFIDNNSKVYTDRNFHSLRFDAEISGPLLYGFIKLTNIFGYAKAVDDTSSAGFELSRFVRFDLDYRKYLKVTQTSDFAFRLYGGIAINILDDPAIPYIRQFYIGGASDLRAWPVRAFGPGASITPYDTAGNNTSLFYDQTADIKLEANAEFRFGIISLLKGAFFVDAGNIWNRTPNPAQPNGEFHLNTFYKQIAVGSGFGLRLDFSFFVMRFDFAFPTYNPVLAPADRWVIKDVIRTFSPFYSNWRSQYMVFNIAIGYPF